VRALRPFAVRVAPPDVRKDVQTFNRALSISEEEGGGIQTQQPSILKPPPGAYVEVPSMDRRVRVLETTMKRLTAILKANAAELQMLKGGKGQD